MEKINIVGHFDELKNPGDVSPYISEDGVLKLAICCPKCGVITGTRLHVYNSITETLHPSVMHGCGAHYSIINGLIIVH